VVKLSKRGREGLAGDGYLQVFCVLEGGPIEKGFTLKIEAIKGEIEMTCIKSTSPGSTLKLLGGPGTRGERGENH